MAESCDLLQELPNSAGQSQRYCGEWVTKRLGDICDLDPENLSSSTPPDFRFNYISLEQVDTGRLLGFSTETFRTAPSRARRVLRYGDILMSTVRPNLMAHLLYTGQVKDAICSTGFSVIRCISESCDPRYLYTHLFGKVVNDQINRIISGSNYPAISSHDIKAIEVPFPPTLEEQSSIAEAIADIDGLHEAMELLITKKKAIKRTAMHQIFNKYIRLGEFSGEWQVDDFARIFERVSTSSHQVQASEYRNFGRYPIVDQGKNHVAAYSDRADKLFRCAKDGLIVFGDHTRTVKFIGTDFVIGADGTQILATKGDHWPKFFYYQLLTKQIPDTGYNRHFKFLKDLAFCVPDLSEQKAIASALTDMDNEITALECQAEKLRSIRQGMMQQLLTGCTRLSRPCASH